jgi:hypothetical protein
VTNVRIVEYNSVCRAFLPYKLSPFLSNLRWRIDDFGPLRRPERRMRKAKFYTFGMARSREGWKESIHEDLERKDSLFPCVRLVSIAARGFELGGVMCVMFKYYARAMIVMAGGHHAGI